MSESQVEEESQQRDGSDSEPAPREIQNFVNGRKSFVSTLVVLGFRCGDCQAVSLIHLRFPVGPLLGYHRKMFKKLIFESLS